MPIEHMTDQTDYQLPNRPVARAMLQGIRCKCPACGTGKMFISGLVVNASCPSCGEELHHHRADDLPAYLNIFIIGHIVVALAIILMDMEIFGLWTLVLLSCALALALAIVLMRPLKGMVVGAQWALRMHGFGGDDS